jgi:hypothetical protein
MIANASGSGTPQGQPPSPQASNAGARAVTVDAAALLGQRVSVVVGQLRGPGLKVDLIWQHSPHQRPGTVLSVQPSGPVQAGTTVVVTAASRPGEHHHDHGHGQGGDGNGQGGD